MGSQILARAMGTLAVLVLPLAAQPASRDSAGVRIISVERLANRAPTVRLAEQPRLVVGGLEDDTSLEFEHNQGYLRGALLSNGGLAVIDVTRMHRFDRNGRRLGITGRKGQGPGEFLYLLSLCAIAGDTVLVYDSHNRRLGVVAPDGEFVRHVLTAEHGSVPFDPCLANRGLLLSGASTIDANGMQVRRIAHWNRASAAPAALTEWSTYPFNMGTQAQNTVLAFGDQVALADADRGEVRLLDLAGRTHRILRLVDPRDRLTNADIARMTGGAVRGNTAGGREEAMARAAATPHPGMWPAFAQVSADPGGRLWIQDKFFPHGSQRGWTAITPDGRFAARLDLPSRSATAWMAVIAFGRDEVLVRVRDEDGAASLAVYPLVAVR